MTEATRVAAEPARGQAAVTARYTGVQPARTLLASRLLFSAGDAHQRRRDQLLAELSRSPEDDQGRVGRSVGRSLSWRRAQIFGPDSARSKQVERVKGPHPSRFSSPNPNPRRPRGAAWFETNTHWTEVSVYTTRWTATTRDDISRRFLGRFPGLVCTGSTIVSGAHRFKGELGRASQMKL